MALIFNGVCMSHQVFETYKHNFEKVKFTNPIKWEHTGEKDWWEWPALIITIVDIKGTEFNCHHTSVAKNDLLHLLGLSQEELKLEFDTKDSKIELTPETFESREV